MKATPENNPPLQLYTTEQAAKLLGFPPQTLRRWRVIGEGPSYCKIGNRVRYRAQDLREWAESKVTSSTALETVSRVCGHKGPATTARYADLAQPPETFFPRKV